MKETYKFSRSKAFWMPFAAAFMVIATITSRAQASTDTYGNFDKYFHIEALNIGPENCKAVATINYDNVVSNMETIRSEWLSSQNTTEYYQRHALEIIYGIIDHKAGGLLLQIIYDKGRDQNPGRCHFTLNLAKADNFGKIDLIPQLSWDFTPALASRIVWDNFDDRNLSKIALTYKFTSEADRLLAETQNVQTNLGTSVSADRPNSCDDISASDIGNAFGRSPYAIQRHLRVIDTSDPRPLPSRPRRGFSCISKIVTNGGELNVFVEPKLLNGKWFISVDVIPR